MIDTYKINFNTGLVKPIIYVSEGDDGLREIHFELYNDDEKLEPTNATIKINNTDITPTITSNVLSFVVDSTLSIEGEYEGEVRCGMGSVNFKYVVEATPLSESTRANNLSTLNRTSPRMAEIKPQLEIKAIEETTEIEETPIEETETEETSQDVFLNEEVEEETTEEKENEDEIIKQDL